MFDVLMQGSYAVCKKKKKINPVFWDTSVDICMIAMIHLISFQPLNSSHEFI